jgi:hypothetical protein
MSAKKILLVGFIVVLLIAIPFTVYLVQQEQKTKSGAEQKTTLSLTTTPQTVNVNDNLKLDVKVNPGNINQVTFVKFTINYDPDYLATSAAGTTNCPSSPNDAFCPNSSAFPVIMQEPAYENGKVSVTLSAGNDSAKAVKALTTVGTIYFKTIAQTTGTDVTFSTAPDTQVLSIGSNDQFNENVLLDTIKATILVPSATVTTATPTEIPTGVPTSAPTTAPTSAPTKSPTSTPQANGPSCTSFTVDPSTSGAIPYNVNLTVSGQSSTSTISKITFNFGDGQTQDITDSAGIGTDAISVLQSHIYNDVGNYTATAILTDADGNVSSTNNCSVTINTNNGTEIVAVATPTPVVIIESNPLLQEQTGPKELITVGSIGAIITIIGAILLLAL